MGISDTRSLLEGVSISDIRSLPGRVRPGGWVCPGVGDVQWLPGKSRGGYVWELGMSVGIFRGRWGMSTHTLASVMGPRIQ